MGEKIVATNRKAARTFSFLERFECGIELKGSEVKSLREGKVSLADCFGRIENGEVYLYNLHIDNYQYAGSFKPDPKRPKKLLIHKDEIQKLQAKVFQKGLALVPLRIYFKRGWAKLEMAVGKGKKLYDRREEIKRRQEELGIKRALRRRYAA